MIQLPYALVFSHDRDVAAGLELVARECGLATVVTRSAARAEELLEEAPVVVVLMSWATSDIAPRQVLSVLRRRYPRVVAVISDEAIREHQVLRSIHAIHPLAITCDPALGHDYLGSRVSGILGRTVGDLCLRDGLVVHQPSGDVFPAGAVGPQLVAAFPHAVRLENRSAAMGVLRFRRWLEGCGSCVAIENARGTGEYRVVVRKQQRDAMPDRSFTALAS